MQPRLKPDVNAMDLFEWALEEEGENEDASRTQATIAAIIASVAAPLAVRRRALELLDAHHKSERLIG